MAKKGPPQKVTDAQILKALEDSGGNREDAAKAMKITVRALYARLSKMPGVPKIPVTVVDIRTALKEADGDLLAASATTDLTYDAFRQRVLRDSVARSLIVRRRDDSDTDLYERFPKEYLLAIRVAVQRLPEEFLLESFPNLLRGIRMEVLAEESGGNIQKVRREMEKELRLTDELIELARWHRQIFRDWAGSGENCPR
jgi:hypothetical protein